MDSQRTLSPEDPDFVERVLEIARAAAADAIAEHHALGRAVYYRRHGQLVEVTPDGRETAVDSAAVESARGAGRMSRRR